ncbi:MAG: hypothetical protein ACKVZ0_22895 [Gemmatimonadales bacterium]
MDAQRQPAPDLPRAHSDRRRRVGRSGTLIIAILVVATRLATGQSTDPVRLTLDRWVAMWNSYDLNQVDSLFVRDSSVSYFSSEYRGLIRGPAVLRDHHQRFGFVPGGKPPGNRLWLEDVVITPTGDRSALVTATWKFQRVGVEAVQSGPVSFVVVTGDAGHRILHAHFANHPAR